VFDASRGWFHSSSVQQGVRALGSDLAYSRYLARTFWYVPAGPFVLASGVRAGFIWNTAGEAPIALLDQLFTAGGSQTVRGYAQDQLSAAFVDDLPIGGTRLLILNQELRFPIMKWVKGVAFADAGNAFATGAFAWSDLAAGLGFGLRIMTPVAPLRIDVGFPIPRRPGDPLYRWHVSIGQMF
jgi:outer membrane translocation and assembly module TamA